MKRRQFLQWSGVGMVAGVLGTSVLRAAPLRMPGSDATAGSMDAAWFRASRRYANLPFGRIAYVERGEGEAAVFLHGAPLNGFQWRGALERLSAHRRCIAPDFMGLGYSEVPEHQSLAADAQVAMLASLLDHLSVRHVDIVASDIGCAVAQLFLARHPSRVRSLLLTNGDVEIDSPPAGVKPVIEMARAGTLADTTAQWLTDTALARSTFGAAVYARPEVLTAETIAYYVTPLVGSPLRRAQYHAFHLALDANPLAGIEATLKRSEVPVRMVWGVSDSIFRLADADYLDRSFPRSQGVRRVEQGKLFFQEEFPEAIAEEARRLWGVS
ncbi:alpha/beta fold hydrolase [Dyella jiangningensis]|uniref:Alpha/beta hydrolase n=1 Tax=Dyella jiangningensis TaxID=1379159 RepID=A0A328P7C3_9GAMM|nr:alpha/beta fold hydrolase [Dyella jiangningensis]RAO77530.1 alpha/beta hydrolase [Dyella jiangningensis]